MGCYSVFSHRNAINGNNIPAEERLGTKGVPRRLAAQWQLVRDLLERQVEAEATRYMRIGNESNLGLTYSSSSSSSRIAFGHRMDPPVRSRSRSSASEIMNIWKKFWTSVGQLLLSARDIRVYDRSLWGTP